LRVLDEFISLNSKKIVLEIKEIQWAHHGSLKPQVNFKYLEMDILLSGDYLFADEEQIQKFEEYETEELRRIKKREGKSDDDIRGAITCMLPPAAKRAHPGS
jgi:hypothetical protein